MIENNKSNNINKNVNNYNRRNYNINDNNMKCDINLKKK